MKIKSGFLLREIDGTALVVAVGSAAKTFNGMITLNDVGTFLWKHLAEGADEETLTAAVLGEYDVNKDVATADVAAFVDNLRKAGVLDE